MPAFALKPSAEVFRPSPLAWLQAALLALNLVWTTLGFGGFRAEVMPVSSALTFVVFALLLLRCASEHGGRALRPPREGWWFGPFLACALINVLWITPVHWLGWQDWLGWAQGIMTFWVALDTMATRGPRRLLVGTAIGLGVALAVLAGYQRFCEPSWLIGGRVQAAQFIGRSSGSFGIPNGLAAFLIVLIPVALEGVIRRGNLGLRLWWTGVAAVFVFALVLTVSRGAWLSLGVALSLWPLLAGERSWAWRTRRCAFVVAGLLGIGRLVYTTSSLARDRFELLVRDAGEHSRPILWRVAEQLWRDAPMVGTGAGSYGILFERYRPTGFIDSPRWAHNDYLNTLSDYGLLGFALLSGACAMVVWKIIESCKGETDRSARRGWAIGLLAFGLSLLVDFNLKLPALTLLVAIGAAGALREESDRSEKTSSSRWPRRWRLGLSASVIVVFWFVFVLPLYRAEALRQHARATIDALAARPLDLTAEQAVVNSARRDLMQATQLDRINAQAWADAAYLTSLLARSDPTRTAGLGRESEQQARAALTLTSVLPDAWWRLGVALDLQGKWIEAGPAFAQALTLAPKSPLSWYYRAYHLSLQPMHRAEALAAVTTCLRLDPGSRVAEILQEQLASPPGAGARPLP